MELEQVWSLHRSEKPTNRVRSPEVPPYGYREPALVLDGEMASNAG
jgi:hypothetical protein